MRIFPPRPSRPLKLYSALVWILLYTHKTMHWQSCQTYIMVLWVLKTETLLQNRCFLLPYHNPTTRQYNHSLFPPPVRKISTVLQQPKKPPLLSLPIHSFFWFQQGVWNVNQHRLILKKVFISCALHLLLNLNLDPMIQFWEAGYQLPKNSEGNYKSEFNKDFRQCKNQQK